ncbi:MAG: Gfo/Idh/MocA family oxidoreductase [Pirellulales bacterium]|nr:Gfo/Idh/MocA family oxidoreductase [Pirellulales bacterium]
MASPIRVSRRRFLQRSAALASAGAAAPFFIPSGVLAAADQPGANDRIGVGYIGTGRRSAQLRNIPKEGRIVAAADVYRTRAEAVAARYRGKAYQDYRDLLDSKDVDAVVVATPDHWHALPSIQACQAGKDVYVEKPMTLTVREGQLMVAAARKHQRIVQVGSQQRSMAANRLGCELVRNGRLGKIHTVIASNYPSPWEGNLPGQPVPEGLDWDAWCGQTEPVPYHNDLYIPRANPGWISFRPYSGGEMTGWGAHGLDQVQWALGMDESGPVEIWTEGEKFDPPTYSAPESRSRGDGICGKPTVFFRYANGVVLRFGEGPGGGAIIVGDKGKITIDRGRFQTEPEELGKEPLTDPEVRLYVSNEHMQNWFDCMKSRKLPVADVAIGHRSTTLCHLGNIARWLGRKARWDPAQEVFPGDAEANAYLTRPQRKPYQLPETV